jgi:hypothetical protein
MKRPVSLRLGCQTEPLLAKEPEGPAIEIRRLLGQATETRRMHTRLLGEAVKR